MNENKDLILLGLSFRLNAYENVNKFENLENKINYNPRKYIKDQNSYLGNFNINNNLNNRETRDSNNSQTLLKYIKILKTFN